MSRTNSNVYRPEGKVAQDVGFHEINFCGRCAAREKRLREVAQAVAQDEAFHPGSFSSVAQGCALRRKKRLRKVCGILLDRIFLDRVCFL